MTPTHRVTLFMNWLKEGSYGVILTTLHVDLADLAKELDAIIKAEIDAMYGYRLLHIAYMCTKLEDVDAN